MIKRQYKDPIKGPHRPIVRIKYGHELEHAKSLRVGLLAMGPDYEAVICPRCGGTGKFPEGYQALNFGRECNSCDGGGLVMKSGKAASQSIVNQVLESLPVKMKQFLNPKSEADDDWITQEKLRHRIDYEAQKVKYQLAQAQYERRLKET